MTERRDLPEEMGSRLQAEWRSLLDEIAVSSASPLALPPDRRLALSRVDLVAQLEEVREEWKLLRGLVDEELSGRFANAGWTLKDLLAHLGSWAKEFRSEIATVASGGNFDYAIAFAMSVLGPNQWNEREVQRRKVRVLEEIFREFDEETARLQDLVAEMDEPALYRPTSLPLAPSGNPEERLSLPPAILVSAKCLHDRYHLAQIRKLLARLGK
jgi:uncharacterized damage-inducible protein DinB